MTNNQRLVLSYFDEDPARTVSDIAASVGVSKQAVSACLTRYRHGWRKEHTDAVAAAKPPAPEPEMKLCPVCKVNRIKVTRRTCGGKCAKAWNSLRWHLDPEFRTKQRKRVAKWMLKHPDKVSKGSLTWARKVVKDKGDAPPSKWLVQGGTPAEYADIIDELPGGNDG